MNPLNIFKVIASLLFALTIGSCKKYLDTKSDQKLSTPGTLKDLQALLDNQFFYRRGLRLANTSSDEYYTLYTNWQSLSEPNKNGYVWDAQVNNLTDWQNQYNNVYYTNTVLDNWSKIAGASPTPQANEIKGEALFYRAQCFFSVAQLYAPQYDPNSANTDHGIPLRLDADFNKPSQRATVQQTYDQIIKDLNEAVTILPINISYNVRPSKAAGYALLARTYLQIGMYTEAKQSADSCLQLYSYLINYNDATEVDTVTTGQSIKKINKDNKEIIFYLNEDGSIPAVYSHAVDSVLYKSYDGNDIRRPAFFTKNTNGTYKYRGSYSGSSSQGAFVGLGTAEVYLIRAEANARLGNTSAALQDLNTLLIKRWKTGTFVPFTATTPQVALDIILQERKKEMVFRGMRWSDIKRLNKEPARAITLQRILNGQSFTLPPNDLRYALLIPVEVIQLSNIQQNARQ